MPPLKLAAQGRSPVYLALEPPLFLPSFVSLFGGSAIQPSVAEKSETYQAFQRLEELKKNRQALILKNEDEFLETIKEVQKEVETYFAPKAMEDLQTRIRSYFEKYRESNGEYPTFPTDEEGGSAAMLKETAPIDSEHEKTYASPRPINADFCTVDDWKHVALSDESHFQLNRADGRVQRQPHESMNPTCQQETVQAGGGSVMVKTEAVVKEKVISDKKDPKEAKEDEEPTGYILKTSKYVPELMELAKEYDSKVPVSPPPLLLLFLRSCTQEAPKLFSLTDPLSSFGFR
ncbi:hypothetical protein TNCV_5043761 [Trichonephila clavipes]|uniref:Uncharacterized protein n=1 Tax=Trichonephila clavipes TaxID=2585209 RepID=A0A8X6WHM1_TRICX|nr:hypothetical protein TNCV_5043761 [Trichonephila clavipes]